MTQWKAPILVVALLLTTWGLFGVFGPTQGYTNALYQPDYTILHAPEGGPLDEAGFMVGDSVVSVEGIPVVELGMYSRWPQSLSRAPGESITMVVEREGELVSGEVVYRERPGGMWGLRLGGLLLGMVFLWTGVWVFLSVPSTHALRLAVMGLAVGVALPGPDLGSWNGVRDHLQVAGMVLWTLMIFRFFLFFPKRKPLGTGPVGTGIVYAPWVALLGCLVTELIFHPRYYHTFAPIYSLLMLGYGLLALVAFLHTMVKTSRGYRQETGMSIVASVVGVLGGGILLLILFFFLPFASGGISSTLVLVGLLALPVGMALGVRKHGLNEAASRGATRPARRWPSE